jgi:hypothetical protein
MSRQHGGEVELDVGPATFKCEGSAAAVESLFTKWQAAPAAPRFQPVALSLGFDRKVTAKGLTMESTLVLQLPDDSFVDVGVKLPLLDAGNNPVLNEDSTPFEPDITLESDNSVSALVEQVPGNKGRIYGQVPGVANVTLTVPMPSGDPQTVHLLTTVTPTAPQPIQVDVSDPQKGEPTPA